MRKAIDISLSCVYDRGLGAHTSQEFSVGRAARAVVRNLQNLGTELLGIVFTEIEFRFPFDITGEENAFVPSIIAADQGLIVQIRCIEVVIRVQEFHLMRAEAYRASICDGDDSGVLKL